MGKSFIELAGTLKPDLWFCNLSRRPPAVSIFPNSAERILHFFCDLSHPAEVERAAKAVEERLRAAPGGQILLVNNSGFGSFDRFERLDLNRELTMIDVNVRAVVDLTGRLLPLLRERGGAIMNIASTVAFLPTPFAATYGASKAFVLHWTIALGEELRGSSVRAIAVCPGTTSTDFFRVAGARDDTRYARRGMRPDRVIDIALRALGAGRSVIVPGLGNKVYALGGSHLPKQWAAWIAGRVLARRQSGRAAS
jgi:short-subunit dehydrogenase